MGISTDSSARRHARAHQARVMREREYAAHAEAIDRFLAKNYGAGLSASEREEIRQEAFASVEGQRAKGVVVKNPEALLITCARNAALGVLRQADRRRRYSFDPLDSPEARMPDLGVAPDVAVVKADEDRRLKMLMGQLDDRSRDVLKLRLELDLDGAEIAAHLGVTKSYAYKLLKKAGRALADSLAANDAGAHSHHQRAVLAACEMGVATPQQRAEAEAMRDDPHARALLAELRGLGRQAAALLPLPAVVSNGRISHAIGNAKQHVADLLGRAPGQDAAAQLAAGGGLRGGGATVAAVVVCIGAGGAAVGVKECIDHDIPSALVDVLPDPSRDDSGDAESTAPGLEPIVAEPLPTQTPEIVTDPSPAQDDTPASASSVDPAPTPPTASDSLSGLAGDPSPEPAPAPPPATTSGGNGPGGSGTAGPTFGGL